MYKKIVLPEKITPVVEEIWFVIHNPKFIAAVKRLRKKHNIIANPSFYLGDWVKENTNLNNFEPLLNLNSDIFSLIMRARISKSMHNIEVMDSLRTFIFTGQLKAFENGLSATALPNVEIKKERERVRFTLFLHYDTGKKEIDKIVRGSWIEIKKAQKELAGDLLKPSHGFGFLADVWDKRYIEGQPEEEIATNELSKHEVRKLLKRMNERIDASFE